MAVRSKCQTRMIKAALLLPGCWLPTTVTSPHNPPFSPLQSHYRHTHHTGPLVAKHTHTHGNTHSSLHMKTRILHTPQSIHQHTHDLDFPLSLTEEVGNAFLVNTHTHTRTHTHIYLYTHTNTPTHRHTHSSMCV